MARPPVNVKLNGQELKGVLAAQLLVERQSDQRGLATSKALPVLVRMIRNATNEASVEGFILMTNLTGGDKQITAEYTIPKGDGTKGYLVTLNKAHITRWELLSAGDQNQPTREIIEIYAGDLTVNAADDTPALQLTDYVVAP
jgi:hypothetical protein